MSDALPQLVADRYRLVQPLGQGGMGRVWKARDEVLHRDVAIKEVVPPPGLTDDERREMRERSLREARAIARLNHVNVVRVFDVLRTDGDPWIVMEYVPSRSLQDTLAADGPVSPIHAAEIGLGVLGALRAAHRSGVMHRDVKPGNVLLGEDGRVVLTDFGLATVPGDPNVTRTGLVLGSPAYIAPERARDGTAGPEADLWSLGATLYAAVEGHSPYARPSAIGTLAALATEPLPPARNAGPLKAVLNGLLRKDPAERINAEVAERLLRRIAHKRTRGAISLLDGVRRPSPLGPREARTNVVPAPRQSKNEGALAAPPSASPSPLVDATAVALHDAGLGAQPVDAALAEKVAADAPADPTAKVEAAPASSVDDAADPTAKVEPPAAEPPTVAAVLPLPAAPTRVDGRPLADDPSTTGTGKKPPMSAGKRRNWLIAAGVAVLLLALIVIVPFALRDSRSRTGAQPGGGQTPQPTASAAAQTSSPAAPPTTSAAPSPSQPSPNGLPAPVIPAGWHLYTDKNTGFRVPVPDGWQISFDGVRVLFSEPNGNRLLMIDQTDHPLPDPVADWKSKESYRRATLTGYQRVGEIHAVPYFEKAADWEWTYTSSSGTLLHVRNRAFVTSKTKAYAIYWETAASTWNQDLAMFQVIADGFRPVGY
jgi:hypothetical protein